MKHHDKLFLYKVTCTKAYLAFDELGDNYSLTPWENNTTYYEGYDDGGRWYILPENIVVRVGEIAYRTPALFDTKGLVVPILTGETGLPVLVLGWANMPELQPLVTAKSKKEAKELTIKVWQYLVDHPTIPKKKGLPSYLYDEIAELSFKCPLCELFRFGTITCQGCPLDEAGQNCDEGAYSEWVSVGGWHGQEDVRKNAAQTIVDIVRAWEVE